MGGRAHTRHCVKTDKKYKRYYKNIPYFYSCTRGAVLSPASGLHIPEYADDVRAG